MSESAILADILKIVIGAVVGAMSGLITGWYTGRRAAQTAVDNWERDRQNAADALAVQAIRELATEAARGTHFACWLTRKAKDDPDRLQEADIDRYYTEMHECLPKLFGAQAALATINSKSHETVSGVALEVGSLDEKVGRACVEWRNGNRQHLAKLYDQTIRLHESITQRISNASSDVLQTEKRESDALWEA